MHLRYRTWARPYEEESRVIHSSKLEMEMGKGDKAGAVSTGRVLRCVPRERSPSRSRAAVHVSVKHLSDCMSDGAKSEGRHGGLHSASVVVLCFSYLRGKGVQPLGL